MPKRTPPTRRLCTPEAYAKLDELGDSNPSRPTFMDVIVYWQDVRKHGLPETEAGELSPDKRVGIASGKVAGDWHLFVKSIRGVKVAVARSVDKSALWLLVVK